MDSTQFIIGWKFILWAFLVLWLFPMIISTIGILIIELPDHIQDVKRRKAEGLESSFWWIFAPYDAILMWVAGILAEACIISAIILIIGIFVH